MRTRTIFGSDVMPHAPPQTMKMAGDLYQGPGQGSDHKPRNTRNTRKEERGVFISPSVCSVYSVVNSGSFLGQREHGA